MMYSQQQDIPRALTPPGSDLHFCCTKISPLSLPRGPYHRASVHFVYHQTSKSSSRQNQLSNLGDLACDLEDAIYLAKLDTYINGKQASTRFFMPNPMSKNEFIELEEVMVKASDKKNPWILHPCYLKFGCDVHSEIFYNVWILEREEDGAEKKINVPAVERNLEFDKVFDEWDEGS